MPGFQHSAACSVLRIWALCQGTASAVPIVVLRHPEPASADDTHSTTSAVILGERSESKDLRLSALTTVFCHPERGRVRNGGRVRVEGPLLQQVARADPRVPHSFAVFE
jgi:hypothetical protein